MHPPLATRAARSPVPHLVLFVLLLLLRLLPIGIAARISLASIGFVAHISLFVGFVACVSLPVDFVSR